LYLKNEVAIGHTAYTSQLHPYLNSKLGDNNQIQTDRILLYIMLGSPQSEFGNEIKLTISGVKCVKHVVPFCRFLLSAPSGRTVTLPPVELGADGSFDMFVNVYC